MKTTIVDFGVHGICGLLHASIVSRLLMYIPGIASYENVFWYGEERENSANNGDMGMGEAHAYRRAGTGWAGLAGLGWGGPAGLGFEATSGVFF